MIEIKPLKYGTTIYVDDKKHTLSKEFIDKFNRDIKGKLNE